MFSHLTDPAVLTGLAMVIVGGLLHAVLLSLITNTHPPTPTKQRDR